MPLHNQQQKRKLNRQASFIITVGLIIISIISGLLLWKEREVDSRVFLVSKIGTAVEDFHTGVMHVSLSKGDSSSPWHYNTGLALIEQALNEFREVNHQIASKTASKRLTQSTSVFREELQNFSFPSDPDDVKLRQASYQLNTNIRSIEKTLRHELEQERMNQRLWFSLAMLITIAMLMPLVALLIKSEYKRLRLNDELRQSERKFLDLAEKIDEVFWLEDLTEDRVLYLSPAFSRIYGIPIKEIYKNKSLWREALHPDDKQQVIDALSKLKNAPLKLEYRIIRRDGEVRWISDRVFPIFDETDHQKASKIATIAADITERKERDNETFHSQKLEAIGQLTGGVSHDFNNLLTVILNNAELLSWKHIDDNETLHFSKMIIKAAERGASLNQHLLAFASKQQLRPQQVSISELIRETEALLAHSIDSHIKLVLDLPSSNDITVSVDPAQLQTALLNLCVNARDAMPTGGTLTIAVSVNPAEQLAFIKVTDTGQGIPAPLLNKVIEPFYTTKERGKGTGLGLSMVYGFVQQSGGNLTIESEEFIGTSITIQLPLLNYKARTRIADSTVGSLQPDLVTANSGFTILIAEDEEFLLETSSKTLKRFGYQVLTASSGAKALTLLKNNPTIDLLFSDIMMPGGIDGIELAEHALALKPNLKVVLTSGYNEFDHIEPSHFLKKPYAIQDMLDSINDILRHNEP
ncbi:PAS domain-containing protein [Idiomarina seosinensis]|uniref:PAS domain-containing hybrid sensor histidine kinase/response regulator n=1 Tax=Idiomarina seosinensis TaxID=281739 RepID=UPI0038515E4E